MLDDPDACEARLLIDNFKECWAELDPDATGEITERQLRKLLLMLAEPVGFALPHRSSAQQAYDDRHEIGESHVHDESVCSLGNHSFMVESARTHKIKKDCM